MSVLEETPDTMRELALQIYVRLVSRAYVDGDRGEETHQRPEALARVSFKLAQAFHEADSEVNPVTIAAAAVLKAKTPFDARDLDLGSLETRR